jgi:hypothetical protein
VKAPRPRVPPPSLVPDAGDEPLIEKRVPHLAARLLAPQVGEHAIELRRVGKDVRAEAADGPRLQLQHRAVPQHGLPFGAPKDEPGPAAAHRTGRDDSPPAGHAQVAAENEAAPEGEQQVLADRLHPEQAAAVEPLRHLSRGGTRMRRHDLDLLPNERLQPARGTVERVPLWHLTPE